MVPPLIFSITFSINNNCIVCHLRSNMLHCYMYIQIILLLSTELELKKFETSNIQRHYVEVESRDEMNKYKANKKKFSNLHQI